ncbi:MAG TPA: hypothetical protein VGR06_17615 [Actinophytocola sp.]|uniref:hypothetical protein n=1 Tax=Actinophytocola sp. TaxID=1872138 RepID=UPI002E016D70|nr:hypothetical protein [Actinophytocola sp.]
MTTGAQSAFATQAGSKATGVRTKVVKTQSFRLDGHEFLKFKAGGHVDDDLDFPPPTCNPFAEFTTTAFYTNGILDGTTTDFDGDIECPSDDPDYPHETMANLLAFTELAINSNVVEQGPVSECVHQNIDDQACTLVFSADGHLCAGQANCAGTYQVLLDADMILPQGYLWTSWPEDECTLVTSRVLSCVFFTDVVVVDPTD